MENSHLKDLFDCISWFSSSHESSVKSELVQRYSRELGEIFRLSGPILRDILSSVIAEDEHINQILQNISSSANEARRFEHGWQKMTSKIYFVLQIEAVIAKIKTLLLEAVSSFDIASKSLEHNTYPDYVKKLQHIPCERISDIIKDVIQEQMENVTPKSELIEKIENSLSLTRNEELLMEIVALDKLKAEISYSDNHGEVELINHIIELINYLHACHVQKYQVRSINNVPIPADFCCPLSLELMFDPVIVASGQTYERSYIKKWLEQGFTVCPKTKQVLSHTNLIPNYTVKALIANCCETNNIKLPDPVKSKKMSQKGIDISSINGLSHDTCIDGLVSSSQSPMATSGQSIVADKSGGNVGEPSLASADDDNASSSEKHNGSGFNTSPSRSRYPSHVNDVFQGQTQSVSASSSAENSNRCPEVENDDDISIGAHDATRCSSDASGELARETPSVPHRETELQTNGGDLRSRFNNLRRRPTDRFGPRIISSLDTRHDTSGIETQVRKLIEELQSDSIDEQRTAATNLRNLAKHNEENRIVIATCGAIPRLVSLLQSEDSETQENAVTALLNLSINDNNKMTIANGGAIEPLIHVLGTGTTEAKENSAATLFSLSVIEENKAKIGRSGAIVPLVELLSSGTPRGKKDASTALFNLSIFHENKSRIVQAGAVRHLVELMDPAAGLVDKAVALLANLASIPEGRRAIGRERGIPYLVEVLELGSARGKENAAAALLHLCTNSPSNSRFSSMVLQEGAIPPLVALSLSGTARGKEKAQSLLAHFRNQRHGNPGRV